MSGESERHGADSLGAEWGSGRLADGRLMTRGELAMLVLAVLTSWVLAIGTIGLVWVLFFGAAFRVL